jgi:hypothetical protein
VKPSPNQTCKTFFVVLITTYCSEQRNRLDTRGKTSGAEDAGNKTMQS